MKTSSEKNTLRERINRLQLTPFVFCMAFIAIEALAATPAGTVIRNQASATYRDASGTRQTATSNIVETRVQSVAGFELQTPQTRTSTAGQLVYLNHALTNTGNMPDRYSLQISNATQSDDFDFDELSVFADADQNGIPDDYTPLFETPLLSSNEVFHFVVAVRLPPSSQSASQGKLIVLADSEFNQQTVSQQGGALLTQENIDTVIVSDAAIINVTKSISQLQGPSPSGSYRVNLRYHNTGSMNVSELVLIDRLPPGMSYLQDSGRADLSPGVVLTDFDPADQQGASGTTVIWCAYDSSCGGLPASQFASSDSTGQVSAIISNVAAGTTANVWFDVNIDAGVAPALLDNTAEYQFLITGQQQPRQNSNTVTFEITGSSGVIANGSVLSPVDSVNEPVIGSSVGERHQVLFNNYIWNTGNKVDTFDIELVESSSTFPANTLFTLFHGDSSTPLLDSNGNSTPDTGPLEPGDVYRVVLRAELPADASGDNAGAGFEITKRARSTNHPAMFNPVTDYVASLAVNSVDLTNIASLNDAQALGAGIGPEAVPLTSRQITWDSTSNIAVAHFSLFVNNTGGNADNYELSVSAATDGVTALPQGWQVFFIDPVTSGIVTVTGVIGAGEAKELIAEVRVPASTTLDRQSLYFTVRSAATGAVDTKHDEVTLQNTPALSLTPMNAGQTEPGGFVVYSHTLQNSGGVQFDNLQLSVQDSLSFEGWQSLLYEDSNLNGQLDNMDQALSTLVSLSPGQSIPVFLKVFAPATALMGTFNNATITLNAEYGDGLAVSATATDVTTVNSGDTTIIKYQAADLGCDGQADSAFSTVAFDIEPGNNCVLYRLVATNGGVTTSYNVVIHDSTPDYTILHSDAECSGLNCDVNQPLPGATGYVRASVPQLTAGDSYMLEFAVKIE